MKYIYIDSNQYRHLFSRSEGFSDSVYELLIKLIDTKHVQLLLPQQTKDEVERNRAREWPSSDAQSLENKCIGLEQKLERITRDFPDNLSIERLKKEISSQTKLLRNEKKKVLNTYSSSRSKPNKKLKKLFEKAILITETSDILSAADFRIKKGNPPKNKENFGDALIWESLLTYLQINSRKAHLLLVGLDKDAWGEDSMDSFLNSEYRTRVAGKVVYSSKLSDIPDLTTEEQNKIRKEEQEYSKQNAVNDFVNSYSFYNAGDNAMLLTRFKKILTHEDYETIILASIKNHEIYQSFFTSIPLNDLVEGENGFAVEKVENIDGALWRKFVDMNQIKFRRQSDIQVDSEKKPQKEEDFPF